MTGPLVSEANTLPTESHPVWPDWVKFCTLGNVSEPLATFSLPESPTFLDNFCVSKSFIFLVESFFGNFYGHLATYSDHTGHNLIVCQTFARKANIKILSKEFLHEIKF